MITEVLTLAGETVVLGGQCVSLLRAWKNAPAEPGRDAADEAGRILVRCRDALACDDPRRAREMIDESTVSLLNVISRVPHDLAFFMLEYHASCVAAVWSRTRSYGG